jgi:hypothetical protein
MAMALQQSYSSTYRDRNGDPVKITTVKAKGFPKSITDRKKKHGDKPVVGFRDSIFGDE